MKKKYGIRSLFLLSKTQQDFYLKNKSLADEKIENGINYRIDGVIKMLFFGYLFIGFYTFPELLKYNPNLTLLENILPRIFFNSIPVLLIRSLIIKKIESVKSQLNLTILLIGVTYMFACMIGVWPTMYNGNTDIFIYIHGTNIYSFNLIFVMVSPSFKYSMRMLLSLIATFYLPLAYILFNSGDFRLLQIFLNDSVTSIFYSLAITQMSYIVRLKLTLEDIKRQKDTESFLGKEASSAIYKDDIASLDGKEFSTCLIQFDFRNYTEFTQSYGEEASRVILKEAENQIYSLAKKYDAKIEKTIGDCYIITIGTRERFKNDKEGVISESDVESIFKGVNYYSELIKEFEKILFERHVFSNLRICGSIVFGNIKRILRGLDSYRIEHDIDGELIILASRLEAYTKNLSMLYGAESSYVILSDNIQRKLSQKLNIKTHELKKKEDLIKNYAGIDKVSYLEFSLFRLKNLKEDRKKTA